MVIDTYSRTVPVAAPVGDAYRAVSTVGGVRAWWTPIVAGVMEPGGELVLGFEGMDEAIGLRVDLLDEPTRVTWTCFLNTSTSAWVGSTIAFELAPAGAGRSAVTLRHDGIDRSLVASGWDRFVESLAAHLELGRGRPFGASRPEQPALEVARAYAHAWMRGDFGAARALLADDLTTDVPIHTYSGADEFIAAVTGFAGCSTESRSSPSSRTTRTRRCSSSTCTATRSASCGWRSTSPSARASSGTSATSTTPLPCRGW